jgi:hypothetical protein
VKEAEVRLHRWGPVLAALVALSLSAGGAYAQTDEEKAAARDLAKKGAEAFIAGNHTEALDFMTRAEALVHAPPHLLYIARAQAALGKLVAARETYLKVTREELAATAPRAFKDAQAQAKEEMAAIEPKIAQLRIVVEGAGGRKVNVKLDGQPVSPALVGVHRPVDPGKHVAIAYPMGLSPVEQTVELKEGEKGEIKLVISGSGSVSSGVPLDPADNPDAGTEGGATPDTTPKSGGISPLVFAGAGVGAVGIGGVVVGVLFTLKRGNLSKQADEKFNMCNRNPPCSAAAQSEIQGLDSDAASAGTIGTIGLVAGGVLLAGGATLVVLGLTSGSKPPPPKPAAAWISPYVAPMGVGVVGGF